MRALCIFVAHSQPTVSIAKTNFYVHPRWEISDALDDKGNRVKGTFKLEFIWPPLSNPNEMPAPRDVVHIVNFATGSSGVRELASTPLQMSYGGPGERPQAERSCSLKSRPTGGRVSSKELVNVRNGLEWRLYAVITRTGLKCILAEFRIQNSSKFSRSSIKKSAKFSEMLVDVFPFFFRATQLRDNLEKTKG